VEEAAQQITKGVATMRYRIGVWTIAGFIVAGFWALYAFATAMTPADRIGTLVQLTCPITLLGSGSYPLSRYLVFLANAATYALIGLIVGTIQPGLNHVK